VTFASLAREIVSQAFGILEKRMPAEGYAFRGRSFFELPTRPLFYNEFWADKIGVPVCRRVSLRTTKRVRARPVVRQVLAEERYRFLTGVWTGR